MAFVVVYDACVLYPALLRDVLVRIGQQGLVQPKWTEDILDEVFHNLTENRPDLAPDKLARTRELMNASTRDCRVLGYEPLIPVVEKLPDPDDRHVVAAAIRAHAQVIVTANLKDFPAEALDQWGIEAKHPDAFVLDQIDLDQARVYAVIQQIADASTRPTRSVDDILDRLSDKHGLIQSAAALRRG